MKARLARLRALLKKETLSTLKDKANRAILVGPFFLYVLLFGYVANLIPEDVPYAFCDLSQSEAAADFSEALDASG